jgi:hypothetical protein
VTVTSGSKNGDGFVGCIAAVMFDATFGGKTIKKNYIAKFCPQTQREEMIRQVINLAQRSFSRV